METQDVGSFGRCVCQPDKHEKMSPMRARIPSTRGRSILQQPMSRDVPERTQAILVCAGTFKTKMRDKGRQTMSETTDWADDLAETILDEVLTAGPRSVLAGELVAIRLRRVELQGFIRGVRESAQPAGVWVTL
jgi:hypothetical protein